MRGFLAYKDGHYVINSDNLVNLLKEIFFKLRLSNTQWKILVNVADRQKNNLIDVDLFFSILNNCLKQTKSIPK
jgi:Ca2+-binding EF-hand superfamily protein